MSKLTFIEKDFFEQLFVMDAGYVLDFSNRTFQEFIYSIMNIDIYKKYEGLSKAKILRAIIAEYDDVTVGKLLLELMRYMQAKNMISNDNQEVFKQCVDIGNKLIGKSPTFSKPKATDNQMCKCQLKNVVFLRFKNACFLRWLSARYFRFSIL